MIELTVENFKENVSNELSLVDFWGNNCQKCKELMPDIEKLSLEYSDKIKFFKFNVDEGKMFAIKEKVMGLPALIIYENGAQKSRLIANQINSVSDVENFIKENI